MPRSLSPRMALAMGATLFGCSFVDLDPLSTGAGGATASSATSGSGGTDASGGSGGASATSAGGAGIAGGSTSSTGGSSPGCEGPAGSYYVDPGSSHCYWLAVEPQTWPDAQKVCSDWGGHLVNITSQGEQDLLTAWLNSVPPVNVWIGAHDTMREGAYMWDGDEVFAFTAWDVAAGQPDEVDPLEDCVKMNGEDGWLWHDANCDGASPVFMCEKSPGG